MSSFDTLDNLERRMSERKAAKLDERIEQLERDLAAATARYESAADQRDRMQEQRDAANARVGELQSDIDMDWALTIRQIAQEKFGIHAAFVDDVFRLVVQRVEQAEQERDAARAERDVVRAESTGFRDDWLAEGRALDAARAEATALRGVVERLHSWLIHHKWCKVYTFAPDYRLDDERCTCNLTATLASAAAVQEPAADYCGKLRAFITGRPHDRWARRPP